MKSFSKLVLAIFFSFASVFLSFSGLAHAAPGDHINAKITIGSGLSFTEPGTIQFDNLAAISSGQTTEYISTGSSHVINFAMSFEKELMGYTFTAATVNGTAVTITAPTHVGGDDNYRIAVSEDDHYVINLTAEKTGTVRHTIIWGNPDVKQDVAEDMKIKNGFARVIGVYDPGDHLVDPITYTIDPNSEGGVFEGYGHVKIEAGMKVVFEFTPIYGYQLTSVSANGVALTPQEDVNQYTFTMPDTNVHFAAVFTKTNNAVVTGSEKVSGGSIVIDNGELDAGTAQLSVNDVDLSAAKIADFNTAAAGYNISNVLDIDFFNVFYKGKNDSEDVWSNQIHELENEATITLKLADDVDVSRVVIVHNIDDGDEFEIIKIDSYDTEAHTVTFRTKSFSNFAIASTTGAPDTGYATAATGSATTSALAFMFAGALVSVGIYSLLRRRG
ncbi:hypothetical protein IJI64_02410 [Candidatus Saccharibacteria bacterium]|nr:hypothetical protein [Candidatus Saccharibacteria bacterium]